MIGLCVHALYAICVVAMEIATKDSCACVRAD